MTSNDNKDQRYFCTFPSDAPDDEPATLAEVGGKALSLIETAADQFPVPPGLVLTVNFFRSWIEEVEKTPEWKDFATAGVDATKDQCDAVKALVCEERLVLTPLQQRQIDEATEKAFGDRDGLGVVAVRSSSPEEDLAGSSFAGGYDTTLGVTSDTLLRALLASFASVFDHRIVQYKIQNGMPVDKPRIAVVIQRQISSDVSGVSFSLNPSNNCYDEVTISANFGLGESVVGGFVTPDVYVVDSVRKEILSKKVAKKDASVWLGVSEGAKSGTRKEINQDPEAQALSDRRILEVAELTKRVEEFKGGVPVDIEWAYQGEHLFLLQARPVTAYLPLFPELLTKEGEEKYLYLDIIVMSQGFSEPMSVLGLDVWKTMLMTLKPQFSVEGKEGMVWNIHGREYLHFSNFLKTTGGRKMVDAVYRQYDPAMGRALDSIDLDDYVPSKMPEGAKGVLWKQVSPLLSMMPSVVHAFFQGEKSMAGYKDFATEFFDLCHDDEYIIDGTFGDLLEAMITKAKEMTRHMGGILAPMISRWRIHRMFQGVKGAEELLVSLCMDLDGNPTSDMGHAMLRLASFPEIQDTDTSEHFVERLKERKSFSEEFLNSYDDFMKKYGCRGMKEIDVATPRRYERVEDFFYQLKQIDLKNNAIITTAARRKAAYEKLLGMAKDIGKEKQFKHHANVIQRLLGYREHPKYMIVVMNGMLRRRALRIGEGFVKGGRLERAEQIFDLTSEQISNAQEKADLQLIPLVRENLKPYEAVRHIKNWPMLIDSRGKIIRQVPKAKGITDGTLMGDPISPGTVEGKAKVLHEPYEKPLKSGEILVARFTEPSWTPIFINAAGVIMEVGGPLQHGAIIAREYGIPCVSGVENAMCLIKDGDLVHLDGSSGVIKLLKPIPAQQIENGST